MKKKLGKSKEEIKNWWQNLTKRDKILIFIFISLIPFIIYFLKIQPIKEKVEKLNSKKIKLKKQLNELKKQKKEEEKLIKQIKMIKKIEKEAEKYLPSKREIATLLTEISKEQEKFNITILELKAEKEIFHQNLYSEIPFKLIISGNFRNTMLFLDNLRKKKRLFNIETIKIKKEKDNLLTECKISTYRFLTNEEIALLNKKETTRKKK